MNRIRTIAFLAFAMAFGSCIKEFPDECGITVNFIYDYNMLSADAFAQQADRVALYVFDDSGILVRQYDGQVAVRGRVASMDIEPLADGRYSFAAWGRSSALQGDDANFQIPSMTVGQSRLDELQYRLRTTGGERDGELNSFLVGVRQADVTAGADGTVTIDMKKVTEKVRVVILPVTGGSTIDADSFSIRIDDPVGNGLINYDFGLLSDAPVTYHPYYKAIAIPQPGENPTSQEVDRAIVAELATSRMTEANQPRLVITRSSTGNEVANINLPWLLSLTKMENHSQWSLQEYLDRQDEFVITLFFQDGAWMNATIVINGWIVNNIVLD